jgi:hypothetical protein
MPFYAFLSSETSLLIWAPGGSLAGFSFTKAPASGLDPQSCVLLDPLPER